MTAMMLVVAMAQAPKILLLKALANSREQKGSIAARGALEELDPLLHDKLALLGFYL